MAVHVKGECDAGVTKAFANDLHVDAGRQKMGRVAMAKIVEPDPRWSCIEVQCDSALLANRAVIGPDQLLYIEGGGWDHVDVVEFPRSLTGCVGGLFQFDEADQGSMHQVRMSIADQDGADLGASGVLLVEASARLQTFAMQFNIVLTKTGWFEVKLSDDDGPFSATRCVVLLVDTDG